VFITYNNQPYGELGAFTGNKTITLTVTNKGSTTYTANITGYVTTSLEQIVYGNQGATYTVGSVSTPASVTVDPGTTKTIQVTVQPSDAWTDIFVEGRVLFTSSDGTRVFPFLGYFGDWALYSDKDTINGDSKWPDNNNIIDLPWWNSDSWDGLTGVYYPYGGGLYYIGRKGGQFEPKALAISAGSEYSEWNDSLVVGLGMLRNARALTIYVLDSAGKVVKTIVSENFVRAGVSSRDSTSAALRTGWSKLWQWDGTDRNGNFVPEGQYTIRIVAMPDPLISDEANLLPTQVMDIPVKVDKTPPVSKLSKWENATATLIDFVDEESGEKLEVKTIIPTSQVFSLVATGTDDSTILSYSLFSSDKAAARDTLNTATFTYDVLQTALNWTGTTNLQDGAILGNRLWAEDGAGNVGMGELVFIAYDSPFTKVGLKNLQAIAEGEYLKVSFNVLNAPGATYQMTIKDGNGSVVHTATGIASNIGDMSEEVIKYKVPAAGKYTIEVTAQDIYGNTASAATVVSLDTLKISIVPDVTFMVVKQGTSAGVSVSVDGAAKTGTVSLSKITVEDGQVKSTVVKAKTFTGNNFTDPTFIDGSLDAGRYQINVEVKSAFGFVSTSSRRVVIDGQAPKIDDVTVISDTGAIVVEKQINGGDINILVRTEQSTTGQLVLKASDDYTYFDVYLDGDHIGGWGDTGAGGEGTFFVPVNLDIGSSQTYTVELVDEAGNNSEYALHLRTYKSGVDLPPVIDKVELKIGDETIAPENGGEYEITLPLPAEGLLTFVASDDVKVASISVKLNGTKIGDSSPVTLNFTAAGKYVVQITAVDSAGQTSTFEFTLNVVEETIITGFELKLEAGMNYFGLPIYVDKTLGEILPGAKVYRRSGTSWVLANDEKPMAYAVYRVSLTEAKTVELVGEPFESSSFTLKQYSSNYMSIPQVYPVNAYDLFGDSLLSISVLTTNGTLVKVTDGIMMPGNAYVVVVDRMITIRLPFVPMT